MNVTSFDRDTERFNWHIGGHSAFQAIMHVLSELRSPLLRDPSNSEHCQRAIKALRTARLLRNEVQQGPWVVIKCMIERAEDEHGGVHNRGTNTDSPPQDGRMPSLKAPLQQNALDMDFLGMAVPDTASLSTLEDGSFPGMLDTLQWVLLLD
jgi:hypothetical protein